MPVTGSGQGSRDGHGAGVNVPTQGKELGEGGTISSAPAAGGAGALPATPKGYVWVMIAGVLQQVPFY